MPLLVRHTLAVAAAVPALLFARGATLAGRDDVAEQLRRRTSHVSTAARVVTAPVWLLVLLRGVLYPAFGADNLESSWGGPTLVGAWVTHFVITVVLLVIVSMVVAVATGSSGRRTAGYSDLDGPS